MMVVRVWRPMHAHLRYLYIHTYPTRVCRYQNMCVYIKLLISHSYIHYSYTYTHTRHIYYTPHAIYTHSYTIHTAIHAIYTGSNPRHEHLSKAPEHHLPPRPHQLQAAHQQDRVGERQGAEARWELLLCGR